jgi:hypothetical protein
MKSKMIEPPKMLQFFYEAKKGGFMMRVKSAHFDL